jgi:hypothetical protein
MITNDTCTCRHCQAFRRNVHQQFRRRGDANHRLSRADYPHTAFPVTLHGARFGWLRAKSAEGFQFSPAGTGSAATNQNTRSKRFFYLTVARDSSFLQCVEPVQPQQNRHQREPAEQPKDIRQVQTDIDQQSA